MKQRITKRQIDESMFSPRNLWWQKQQQVKNIRIMNKVSETTYPPATTSFKYIFIMKFSFRSIQNNNKRQRSKKLQCQVQSLSDHKVDHRLPQYSVRGSSIFISTIICRGKCRFRQAPLCNQICTIFHNLLGFSEMQVQKH